MFNCRKVTQMVSESMDRRLPLHQRAMIKFHLLMCKYCARFEKQLRIMREICRQQPDHDTTDGSAELSSDACEKIKAALRAQAAHPDPQSTE